MKNVLLFGLLVVLVWGAVEVTTKGVDGAFGGLFAGFQEPVEETRSTGERAGDAFQRAYDKSTHRVDDQLARER